ncbi:Metallo-dependent phosphatase [Coccomyxa subellipsoidea C-169]|uniref:Metallo-dependent phosphatase n=1 Tax=Coccomyxa subellipsoidea (strain C-169) TaxID=574566 RepID=I0Z4G3_COCSC|nr:Metallo-dependent phosphatase [Coccomyxa subellipsoidea C-169]EIE25532.1 Metallo-dependent phosphatase [Coccomyxa subellipsoidea C-169]|eukprot:XP_005650076.1 Metallo-dependent phosphatase [Coccomyxa subellipsoidea C-169]
MLDFYRNWFGSRNSKFCTEEFPKVTRQPTFLPAVPRLVAIGDLHGDLKKARRAFRLGGLTDANDRWIGGTTTAVQVGDQLDRGNDEVRILYFLERLEREAERAGGKLHILNGNHETMNVAGRFNYATLPGLADFYHHFAPGIGFSEALHCSAGAVTARFLADHPIALQIGSTVFVHGGVLPQHAELGLERINQETRAWMRGEALRMPSFLTGRQAIVWAREYSAGAPFLDSQRCDCAALEQVLGRLPGAERMVVGHTIQDAGINSACEDRVFRIDVGLSKGCGDGEPQV